jgi:hypothetical protein
MQTVVAEILRAWRRAERLAAELPAGSSEQAAAELASRRLRELFQDLTAAGINPAAGKHVHDMRGSGESGAEPELA